MRKQKMQKLSDGFTLAELLVSVFIIVIITAVVAFNQKDFTDQIALSNSLTEIELDVKQAQVYGIGVKELVDPGGGSSFDIAYGASFRWSSGGSNSYVLFADLAPTQNGRYDGNVPCVASSGSECLLTSYLTKENKINKLCAIHLNSGTWTYTCNPTVDRVDIVYKRPNSVASFTYYNGGSVAFLPGSRIGACVEVISPKLQKGKVIIYETGLISSVFPGTC